MKLLQWQRDIVEKFNKQKYMIIEAETGLGKGILGSYLAMQYLPATVIIVTPPHIISDWKEKLVTMGVKEELINIVNKDNQEYLKTRINIVSYQKMVRYAQKFPIGTMLILDEAHYIKSPTSKRFKYLIKQIKRVDSLLSITATLVTKSSLDLYTNTFLVNKELRLLYRNWWEFRNNNCIMNIIWQGTKSIAVPTAIKQDAIEKYCYPYIEVVSYKTAGIPIPEYSKHNIYIETPRKIRDLFNQIQNEVKSVKNLTKKDVMKITANEYMQLLNKINSPFAKYFQLVNGFVYDREKVSNDSGIKSKAKETLSIVNEEYNELGNKGLLVYFFKAELTTLTKVLGNKAYYHNPTKDIQQQIREFENSKTHRVFVANIKSIGEGIRFKDTNYMIEFTTIYDYGAILQAQGRLRYVNRETPYKLYKIILDLPEVKEVLSNIDNKEYIKENWNVRS